MKLPVWAVLALGAAGCSLIIPLDYTGGVGGSSGSGAAGGSSGAGNAPQGGTSHGAEAGVGDEGGNPQGGGGPEGGTGGSAGNGGTNTGGNGGTAGGTDGGTSGSGGTSGGVGGSSMGGEDPGGEAGTGAAGASGGGGASGSGGAMGGRGGRGGMGGGGMAGTAGCSFDLTSNPMHCGSCTNACPGGNECIDSECVATPCDKLGCGSIQMADYPTEGPRKTSVNTTNDVCVEVPMYTPTAGHLPAINCWNSNGRKVEVNEVAVSCGSDQPMPVPKRKGGYCFHAFSGGTADTGFVMPYAASSCCVAPNGGTGGT